MGDDRDRWRIKPKSRVSIDRLDSRSTAGAPGDKTVAQATCGALRDELAALQERLYAEGERKLLVVLQAMDTGGKGGTIKHVFRGVNPAGLSVVAFKAPTQEELDHDFLWRIHHKTPGAGMIGIFDRSHYEDVLIVRVHELVPEDVWRARYEHIRAFERNLVDAGTTIVKIYLHISEEEQSKRLQARLDNPEKNWKFRAGDLEERQCWPDYMAAFDEAIKATSTAEAPWYVIPADRKWYRDWAVLQVLLETLREMDPQFPEAVEDLSRVVVE
ncbi:MAG: polyphosphate kinase 2 family protein [Acidimicrobiia bacterium]|nr:polyphosphate kinase 2 family protein [Acidimicrobiia bacterium]